MAGQTEPQTYGELFMHGHECYSYEIDGTAFILLDREDVEGDWAPTFVIDIQRCRYYTLQWHRSPYHTGHYYPDCNCAQGVHWDHVRGEPIISCPHYLVWERYFKDYIYEPPEL